MIESAARAQRFEVESAASPVYFWEVPQKPVSVKIPLDIMDRLEQAALDSFRSLTSRGSEIGGVLFGSVAPGVPSVVTVQDYELIPCDYARGPLYRLSDADLGRFDRAIAQRAVGKLMLTGFFRSHTRKGLALDPEDLAMFESRFRDPHHFALLIRPFAAKPSTAGIFIREGGVIHSESSYLEFPFRGSELSPPVPPGPGLAPAEGLGGALPAPSVPKTATRAQIVPIASRRESASAVPAYNVEPPSPIVTPEDPATAAPAPSDPFPAATPPMASPTAAEAATPAGAIEPAKPGTGTADVTANSTPAPAARLSAARSSKWIWIAVGAAIPLILTVVMFLSPALLHRGSLPPSAGQDPSQLSLRVERLGGEITLNWNADSNAIRNAAHAVLLISDGDRHEPVDLDLGLLKTGSISYSPATSDVTFQMEVTGANGQKTSSKPVRAISAKASPLGDPVTPPAAAAPGAPKPANAAAKAVPNDPDAAAPGQPPSPEEDQAPRLPDRVLKPFQAEPLAQRLRPGAPAAPAALPEAPSVGRPDAPGAPVVSGLNLGSGAPPPPAPAASKAGASSAKVLVGGQIQPAQLIRRLEPEYPRIARESGAKGTVELLATIGADGKVKKVAVVKGHPLLQKAAEDAVMQWVYKPTLLNGVAVETETQVLVNFVGGK